MCKDTSSSQRVGGTVSDNILNVTTGLTNVVCHAYPWLSWHFCLRGQTTRVNSHSPCDNISQALNLPVSTKGKSNDKKLALIIRLQNSKPVAYKIKSVLFNIRTRAKKINAGIIRIFSARVMRERERERGFRVFNFLFFKNMYYKFIMIYKAIAIHGKIINTRNVTRNSYLNIHVGSYFSNKMKLKWDGIILFGTLSFN
jgi:hypothetical protein